MVCIQHLDHQVTQNKINKGGLLLRLSEASNEETRTDSFGDLDPIRSNGGRPEAEPTRLKYLEITCAAVSRSSSELLQDLDVTSHQFALCLEGQVLSLVLITGLLI